MFNAKENERIQNFRSISKVTKIHPRGWHIEVPTVSESSGWKNSSVVDWGPGQEGLRHGDISQASWLASEAIVLLR
jgi:hypothetical protein